MALSDTLWRRAKGLPDWQSSGPGQLTRPGQNRLCCKYMPHKLCNCCTSTGFGMGTRLLAQSRFTANMLCHCCLPNENRCDCCHSSSRNSTQEPSTQHPELGTQNSEPGGVAPPSPTDLAVRHGVWILIFRPVPTVWLSQSGWLIGRWLCILMLSSVHVPGSL